MITLSIGTPWVKDTLRFFSPLGLLSGMSKVDFAVDWEMDEALVGKIARLYEHEDVKTQH